MKGLGSTIFFLIALTLVGCGEKTTLKDNTTQSINRDREAMSVLKTMYNDVPGDYEGSTQIEGDDYAISAELNTSDVPQTGTYVPQPQILGSFVLTNKTSAISMGQEVPITYSIASSSYDPASHNLAATINGTSGAPAINVRCMLRNDQSLSCNWNSLQSGIRFSFVLKRL